MADQTPQMKHLAAVNALENELDWLPPGSTAIKMITKDLAINKIESKAYPALESKRTITDYTRHDKRTELRKYRTFPLKCSTYNPESDSFEISDVIAHNCSSNGLYFEAANSFEPQDPVCLSSTDQFMDNCESEFANGVHAQIIWCKLLDTSVEPRYGVGAKYFEPIESNILSF